MLIAMRGKEGRPDCCQQSPERAERIVHGRSLISTVYHAIGAARIARFSPVFMPRRCFHQFLECFCITVLKQITGLLPAKNVVRGHAPGRARVLALTHEKFQKQRRLIELPASFAIGKDGAEQLARASASKEVLLIRSL